uniref:Uncharacterized protein n=1 Tax=Chromera velia CCMP2878 TaxID=1169474 RepID=A0A0G4GI86_9ALVE|eukprot:Cvel_22009.t1-p1 / transcript=Cvel_22009.t1 / gene=Cvel_22009 / organism=Chromera_velia_CCMP2878 / gene_product=hypothetical protein / transcript_product=hypothetical protein / location=Cvel_scaffold2122:15703-21202(-) / protein_length=103 / sequence_SO=supercontig / SO=protein_coding / is_pseudo=false
MSNVISFSQAGKRLALLFSPPFVSSSQAGIGVTLPAETGQKERKKDEKEDAGSQMRNGVHCMGLGAAHCENSLKERLDSSQAPPGTSKMPSAVNISQGTAVRP